MDLFLLILLLIDIHLLIAIRIDRLLRLWIFDQLLDQSFVFSGIFGVNVVQLLVLWQQDILFHVDFEFDFDDPQNDGEAEYFGPIFGGVVDRHPPAMLISDAFLIKIVIALLIYDHVDGIIKKLHT